MEWFKVRWVSVLTAVFWLGCLTGFILQSKEVCQVYFKYQTRASTTMSLDKELATPSLTVCHIYVFILNRTDYKLYRIAKDPPGKDDGAAWRDGRLLTIKQLFELTPGGNETIQYCAGRLPGMWTWKEGGGASCLREVDVKKFFMQEYMCYMYTFKNMPTLSLDRVAHALSFVNTAYRLDLKDHPPSLVLFIFAHSTNGLPLMSRNYGKQIDRITSQDGYSTPNKMFVVFNHIKIQRLPPPYDTSCTFDEDMGMNSCRRTCLIKQMRKINRVPFTEMIFKPVDLKHVSDKELSNETNYQVIDSIHQNCESSCRQFSCDDDFMMTNVHVHNFLGKDFLDIRLMIPNSPTVNISYTASVTFLDFFVYICSSFGLWFGLSLASFNPRKLGKVTKVAPDNMLSFNTRVELLMQIVSGLKGQLGHLERQNSESMAMLRVLSRDLEKMKHDNDRE